MTKETEMPDKIWVLKGDSISPPEWSIIPFGCSEPYHHDRIVKTLEAKVKELQQCVVALASTLEEIEHGNALACALNATLIKESKEALG